MGTPNASVNTKLTHEEITRLKVLAIEKGHKGMRTFVTELLRAELNKGSKVVDTRVDIRPPELHPGDEWHCTYCFRWRPADERRGKICVHCE